MYSIANLLSKGSAPASTSESLNLKPEGRAQTICLIAETLLAIVGAVIAAYGIIHGIPIAAAVGGGIVGLCAIDVLVTLIIRNVRKHLDAKQEKPQASSPQEPEVSSDGELPSEPSVVAEKTLEQRKAELEKQKSEISQKLKQIQKRSQSIIKSRQGRLNLISNDLEPALKASSAALTALKQEPKESVRNTGDYKNEISNLTYNIETLAHETIPGHRSTIARLDNELKDLAQKKSKLTTLLSNTEEELSTLTENHHIKQRSLELQQKIHNLEFEQKLLQMQINGKIVLQENRTQSLKECTKDLEASQKKFEEFRNNPEKIFAEEIARCEYTDLQDIDKLKKSIPIRLQDDIDRHTQQSKQISSLISKLKQDEEALVKQQSVLSEGIKTVKQELDSLPKA